MRRFLPCGVMSHEKIWPSSFSAALAPNMNTSCAADLVERVLLAQAGLRVIRSADLVAGAR
jgi:hypothetical protein